MKDIIFASDITDTDTLLKVLQSLPRKPQCVRNKNWSKTCRVSINLDKIYGSSHVEECQKWLDENNLSLAWDGKFWITNSDMLLTCLLEVNPSQS